MGVSLGCARERPGGRRDRWRHARGPRTGMVGALPPPAWGAVVGMLSSPEGRPERAWQATVLSLRRTCKALAKVVGAGCAGGAGWLEVKTTDDAAKFEAAATAGLGRALAVIVWLPVRFKLEQKEALARALAWALERGHMIHFGSQTLDRPLSSAFRMFEEPLIEASHKGLLLLAELIKGESMGWSADAMAQLSVVGLYNPRQETIATLVDAGALQRLSLRSAEWADMSFLSSLRDVKLDDCPIEDLSPLADVPLLVVTYCSNIKALPAMRNEVLEVYECGSLTDPSGLAGGRVGRLELRGLPRVEDVSVIGAMHPPPRTVILEGMAKVQDVSMLAGVRRLEVIRCPKLDKAATLAALEGKVGTIRWEGNRR